MRFNSRWWIPAGTALLLFYLVYTDRWSLVDPDDRDAPPPPPAVVIRESPRRAAAVGWPAPAPVERPAPVVPVEVEKPRKPEKAAKPAKPRTLSAEERLAASASREEADRLFAELRVLRIEIDIPPDGEEALRGWHWRNWQRGGSPRPSARATVREGGRVYRDVAIHLKGSAGSFRSIDDQPGLTLKFDKHVPEQRFHGLKQLSLNNSVQDPSLLSEKICRELFLAAGVPTPRAAHSLVTLNHRDLGLYVLVEGYNRQFLERHFSNPSGNLFDGGFVHDITETLEVNCGDDPEDHSPLERLLEAASEADGDQRLKKLAEILDVERFLAFVALEVMTCHWDGYTMNRNNYRVFHDLDSGRVVFMPHGLDQVFGIGRGSPSQPIIPRSRGMVAGAILESDEGRQKYFEKLGRLFHQVFDLGRILRRVDEVSEPIRSAIAESQPDRLQSFQYRVEDFKESIRERARSIESQLAAGIEATAGAFNAVIVPLGSWRARTEAGDAAVVEEEGADGRPALVIRGGPDGAAASWHAVLVLNPGRYRFEGRVRCRQVEGTAGGEASGAYLRVDGQDSGRRLTGSCGWTSLVQRFRVGRGGPSEVDLACELRCGAGDAWFDKQSLRVVREEEERGWRGR